MVGKEFNNKQMDGLFAGPPPFEAFRYLIHEAATVRVSEPMGSKVLVVNDVSRAFFEAPATRYIYIIYVSRSRRNTLHTQTAVVIRSAESE